MPDMGARFGDYRLMRLIARGGMGEVYLAVLERGGFAKPVALKRILPTLACRPEFVALFSQEATLAARLNHPNIVQVFDHGCLEGHSYLAMEFVEGADLGRLLEAIRGPLPAPVAAEIAVQLGRALCHAHQRRDLAGLSSGVVHGDLSPSNVLLSREGAVKLADFGLARLRSMATARGTVAGKFRYLSPEQADGQGATSASDIYALGLVVYEMFTGRPALAAADSQDEALVRATQGVRELPGELMPAMRELLRRSLAFEPEARPQSAAEVAQAISAIVPPCGPEGLAAFLQRSLPASESEAAAPERTALAARPVAPPRSRARRLWLLLFATAWMAGFVWWAAYPAPTAPPRPLAPVRPAAPTGFAAKLAPLPPADHPEVVSPATAPEAAPDTAHVPSSRAKQASLTIIAAPHIEVLLDHRAVRDRTLRIQRRAALLELVSNAPVSPLRVRLRLEPAPDPPGAWALNAESSPWSNISMDGQPAGQTPRSSLTIGPGAHRLEFERDGQAIGIELTAAAPVTP